MARTRRRSASEDGNPYIVFADVCVSLVLILVVLLAMGQLGRADDRYLRAQSDFERAVMAMPASIRPAKVDRDDPPGAQRWTYLDRALFNPDNTLTASGQQCLTALAGVLRDHKGWERIRIEGHALPSRRGEPDNWASSAAVAALTAQLFQEKASLEPWRLAVAGRGGQTPYCKVYLDGYATPQGQALARHLHAEGVQFSDGKAKAVAKVSVAINLGEQESAPQDLPKMYRRNLRVEVVVEFLSTSNGE